MNLSVSDGGLAPYIILICFGFLPSEIWRWLSFFVARGVNEGSELFIFARTVSSVSLVTTEEYSTGRLETVVAVSS